MTNFSNSSCLLTSDLFERCPSDPDAAEAAREVVLGVALGCAFAAVAIVVAVAVFCYRAKENLALGRRQILKLNSGRFLSHFNDLH